MISSEGILKLCDFGFARRVHEIATLEAGGRYTSYVATRWYRAPELLALGQSRGHYGPKVDVWAVGCLVAELLTGKPAFPGATDVDQLQLVLACTGPLPNLFQPPSDSGASDAGDATHAASTVAVAMPATLRPVKTRYAHLGKGVVSFLECCLEGNPENRPSPAQLFEHPWLTDNSHSWLTHEFLAAREKERNALIHHRELVVRRQRMQLSTAQVLQLPPQSNCSSTSAKTATTTTAPRLGAATKPQSVYATNKVGISANVTANGKPEGPRHKHSHGSSPTKFHPRRLATSTGIAVSSGSRSGSGRGTPLSKYSPVAGAGAAVSSVRIPHSSNGINNAPAFTNVGGIHSQQHRNINKKSSNTSTTYAASAAASPLRASPYLTRGARHAAGYTGNVHSGSSYSNSGVRTTSAGILRPPTKTTPSPSPTKRNARPTRSKDDLIATARSNAALTSLNGPASAAGANSSGSGASCNLISQPPPSRRHITFTEDPPQILQAPVPQSKPISNNQHDIHVTMQAAAPTVLPVSAAAAAETPQQPKHRGFLSRLMHGSKRESKVPLKSPERGMKRSGLSST